MDRLNQYLKGNINESYARQLRGLPRDNGHIFIFDSDLSEKTHLEFRDKFERLTRDLESAAKIDENSLPKIPIEGVRKYCRIDFK